MRRKKILSTWNKVAAWMMIDRPFIKIGNSLKEVISFQYKRKIFYVTKILIYSDVKALF